ncbi:uncharacterized protein LOC142333380 [Lycorma delicatula]|uniref:uncharacterized protein LOC142333380 n=1 Tax=Lycorma delicatula TaxID=130591 RepID=UPI003F50D955
MYHLKREIQLFCILINEIDDIIYNYLITNKELELQTNLNNQSFNENNNFITESEMNFKNIFKYRLKKYLKQVADHQKYIYRMHKSLNKSVSISSLILNETVCLLGCMCLFWIAETNSIIQIVEYALFLSSAVIVLYFYLSCGQKIVDEGENMRIALYECNWVDKPKWFKTSILMMMIRSTKMLGLKPFGLNGFMLNMNTFSMVNYSLQ